MSQRDPMGLAVHEGIATSFPERLCKALQHLGVPAVLTAPGDRPDLVVHRYWPDAPDIPEILAADAAVLRETTDVVLEAPDPHGRTELRTEVGGWNERLAALATDRAAHLLPLRSKFQRWGPAAMLEHGYELSDQGVKAIARAIERLLRREVASVEAGRLVHNDLTQASGAGLRALRGADPASADALVTTLTDRAALAAVLDGPAKGDQDAFRAASSEGLRRSRELLTGRVAFAPRFGWPSIPLDQGGDIDWAMTGPDRTWQSKFLGLDFLLRPLQVARELLHDPGPGDDEKEPFADPFDLVERCSEVACDFLASNPTTAPASTRAWHEGTAARRLWPLLALLAGGLEVRERGHPLEPGSLASVASGIVTTAGMLTSDEMYIEAGNHGVRQDLGLYAVARVFAPAGQAEQWRALALDRLEHRQFRRALTRDGVWWEHSPGYHLLVFNYLSDAHLIAGRTGDEPALELLAGHLDRMAPFLRATLLRDGSMLPVGDTSPGPNPDRRRRLEYRLALSATARGLHHFPHAGYLVWRPPDEDPDGLLLSFHANLRTAKHKQADDLSLHLREGERSWLLDGGALNKETSDVRRNSARFDPGAHNTWRVGGEGYSFRARSAAGVRWLGAVEGDGWLAGAATNGVYDRGEVLRSVAFVPELRTLVVLDHVSSKASDEVDFEQFWHLPPGAAVTEEGGGFRATVEGRRSILAVAVDQDQADRWDRWEGDAEQPIGWTMSGHNTVVPNPVLRRSFEADRRWCATVFALSAEGAAAPTVTLRDEGGEAIVVVTTCAGVEITVRTDLTGTVHLERRPGRTVPQGDE